MARAKDHVERSGIQSVRDANGVIHLAYVNRFFDYEGDLIKLVVSTGCSPRPSYWARKLEDVSWYGAAKLPQLVLHNGTTIVEWRVREVPTCLACSVAPTSF